MPVSKPRTSRTTLKLPGSDGRSGAGATWRAIPLRPCPGPAGTHAGRAAGCVSDWPAERASAASRPPLVAMEASATIRSSSRPWSHPEAGPWESGPPTRRIVSRIAAERRGGCTRILTDLGLRPRRRAAGKARRAAGRGRGRSAAERAIRARRADLCVAGYTIGAKNR